MSSSDDSICGLMLVYVSGCGDEEECAKAEALLCAGTPGAAAAYAEAVAVYHCVPMTLQHVKPPDHCRHTLLGRVTADLSNDTGPAAATLKLPGSRMAGPTAAAAFASSTAARLRWPIYVASGLAACLAVALSVTMANNRRLETSNERLAGTLAGAQSVLRSSHVTLASLTTDDAANGPNHSIPPVGDGTTKSFARVLFCPVTKHYQVTVFNLPSLPAGQAYELWLITPDKQKVPAGVFQVDGTGTATVMAQPAKKVDVAYQAAITTEPDGGSDQPTSPPVLAGSLESN